MQCLTHFCDPCSTPCITPICTTASNAPPHAPPPPGSQTMFMGRKRRWLLDKALRLPDTRKNCPLDCTRHLHCSQRHHEHAQKDCHETQSLMNAQGIAQPHGLIDQPVLRGNPSLDLEEVLLHRTNGCRRGFDLWLTTPLPCVPGNKRRMRTTENFPDPEGKDGFVVLSSVAVAPEVFGVWTLSCRGARRLSIH